MSYEPPVEKLQELITVDVNNDLLKILDASTGQLKKISPKNLIGTSLENLLPQGLSWNETDDTYARTGSLIGIATGVSAGDANLPIHSQMRRCLMKAAGVVEYYLSATDSTKKEDGVTSAVLDGTDGQVMVEIPKFYYKYSIAVVAGDTIHTWQISAVPLSGYEVHPMFNKAGTEKPFAYIGAYEGMLYDTSASRYANGKYLPAHSVVFADTDNSITTSLIGGFAGLEAGDKLVITGTSALNGTYTVATVSSATKIIVTEDVSDATEANTEISTQKDYTATTGDKLSSVNDKMPITNLTRANTRVLASNRGAGWFQQDFDTVSAIQLLFLIEYGSFNSQSVLGVAITNVNDWAAYNNYNPIAISGNSNAIGDASGNNAGSTSAATESTKYLSYRGIENFWGHIMKFVDGISINANAAYVHSTPNEYTDDSDSNYTLLGTLGSSGGYIRTILPNKRGFLPTSADGSSSVGLCDYYEANEDAEGWRVACFGGYAYYGAKAGAFDWILAYDSGPAYQYVGCRLACF
jgi:hypothetical protein